MVLKDRDRKILEMVQRFGVVTVDTVYKSIKEFQKKAGEQMARTRLRKMYEDGLLGRTPHTIGERTIYFDKKPKQMRHKLLLVELYAWLKTIAIVDFFDVEYPLSPSTSMRNKGDYIADAFIGLTNKYTRLSMDYYCEIHISHNSFPYEKYDNVPLSPALLVVTDQKLKPHPKLKTIVIKTDFSNIMEVLK